MNLLMLIVLPFAVGASATETKTVVFIGDSLTAGQGVRAEEAYPALIQDKLTRAGKAWTVINAGVRGSLSDTAPARCETALKGKPDLIVLALGANDGLRRVPLTTIEANLARALALCQAANVKVLLVGLKVPPGFDTRLGADVEEMFKRLAKRFDVPLLASMLEGVAGVSAMNQSDRLHPNAAGQALIADHVYEALEPLL